jgi:hypothetical protein
MIETTLEIGSLSALFALVEQLPGAQGHLLEGSTMPRFNLFQPCID